MDFIKERLDNPNAWIGVIGLVLFFLNLHTLLWLLFALLIILPAKQFSDWFSSGANKIRSHLDD